VNIRPLQDRIVVKRIDSETVSPGGIVIPGTVQEKPAEGIVTAVGNGKVLDNGTVKALDVKVGDRVLFGKYGGVEVKIEGVEHLILREEEIVGVLE
jgi:chaperonin GroES